MAPLGKPKTCPCSGKGLLMALPPANFPLRNRMRNFITSDSSPCRVERAESYRGKGLGGKNMICLRFFCVIK